MTSDNLTFNLKRPTREEANAVLELQIAVDMAEYGEPDSDLGDLLQQWGEIDLYQDTWLAYTTDGKLAGYAAILPEPGELCIDLYVHPELGSLDLRESLFELCEQRAQQIWNTGSRPVQKDLVFIASHTNKADRQVLENRGYTPRKYYFRMQIEMNSPPPAVKWPTGSLLRTFNPGQDDGLVYDFIRRTFERPDRISPTFERWKDFMMRPDHFIPELWFLLFNADELVSLALCFDYQLYGWVRQFAVAKQWRRQGIGTKMLKHIFGVFYRRGRLRVALGMESHNARAYALYERVGMQRVRQYDEYTKRLRIQ